MPNESLTEDIHIEGTGSFAPPPSPCGNPECGWVELDLVHTPECEWESPTSSG